MSAFAHHVASVMLRVSIEEAIARGWIKAPQKAAAKSSGKESPPHDLLHEALLPHLGERLHREFAGAVPGRKFSLDLAVPDMRLAIEVDGFANHGKTLAGFKKDRTRQNLLAQNGWVVLRYFPAQIYKDIETVVRQVLAMSAPPADENETAGSLVPASRTEM